MGFSATGNILPGSIDRPEILTFMLSESKGISTSSSINTSMPNRWDMLGYIPVVSTVTGSARTILGLVHAVVHAVCLIFSADRDHHYPQVILGAKNIGRGLVETIPVIGNIILAVIDLFRCQECVNHAKQQFVDKQQDYLNLATLFIDGQVIAQRPIAEVNEELKKLNKFSDNDLERIIRN